MDVCLSDPQDLLSDSGTDSEEPGNIGEHQERKAGTSPHHRQSANFMDSLTQLGAPEVCRRVLNVLGYMESLQLNLPILLWALCWNDPYPDLISSNEARFAGTGLAATRMVLSGIFECAKGLLVRITSSRATKYLCLLWMLDLESTLMRSLWRSVLWRSVRAQFSVESPDFDFAFKKTGLFFYLALLAINYRSEKIIFQVSTYSRQHISRKHLMRRIRVFSLSGGGNWSAGWMMPGLSRSSQNPCHVRCSHRQVLEFSTELRIYIKFSCI
jgi:hypothetical protein